MIGVPSSRSPFAVIHAFFGTLLWLSFVVWALPQAFAVDLAWDVVTTGWGANLALLSFAATTLVALQAAIRHSRAGTSPVPTAPFPDKSVSFYTAMFDDFAAEHWVKQITPGSDLKTHTEMLLKEQFPIKRNKTDAEKNLGGRVLLALSALFQAEDAHEATMTRLERFRLKLRQMVHDPTRPSSEATDDEVLKAVQDHINQLNELLVSNLSSESTVRFREMIKAFRDQVNALTGLDRRFSLQQLGDAVQSFVSQTQELVGSEESMDDVVRSLKTYVRRFQNKLGEDVTTIEEASKRLTKQVEALAAGMGESANSKVEDLAEAIKHMLEKLNTSFPNELQVRNPTMDEMITSCSAVTSTMNDLFGRLPTTAMGWQEKKRVALTHIEAAAYLAAEAGTMLGNGTDGPKIKAILERKALAGASVPAPVIIKKTTVDWRLLAHDLGLSGPSDTEEEFRRAVTSALASASRPATTASGTDTSEALTSLANAISALSALPTASEKKWSCKVECSWPLFDNDCTDFLQWEKDVKQQAAVLWDKHDPGFAEAALNHLRACLRGDAAKRFRAEFAEFREAAEDTTTYGRAAQAMIDLFGQEYGVDRRAIQEEAKAKFLCSPIKADCHAQYWSRFTALRDDAGLDMELDMAVIKERYIAGLPTWVLREVERVARAPGSRHPYVGKPRDLTLNELKAIVRPLWQQKQDPVKEPSMTAKCSSGLGDKHCPCTGTLAPLDSTRNFPPSCNSHTSVPDEVWTEIVKTAKSTDAKRGVSSPSFAKWADERGICEICWHVKNQANYQRWVPNQPHGRSRSRSPGRG